MKLLYRLTPHSRLSHNPLFAVETRRIRWGYSARVLADTSILLVGVVCVVVLLIWLLAQLVDRRGRYSDLVLLMILSSLLVSLLLDYRCMTTAVEGINGEVAARRWDVLRLTELANPQIVAAKYGAAQVRVWRLMALIVGSRAGLALTVGLSEIVQVMTSSEAITRSSGEIISLLFMQGVLVIFACIYVIEPYWRMRTVTALGLAVSARTRERLSTVLVAVGALAAFWLAQGIVIVAMMFGTSVLLLPLGLVEYSVNRLVFCAPLIFLILLLAAVYGFYSTLRAWGLRYAERWTARLTE